LGSHHEILPMAYQDVYKGVEFLINCSAFQSGESGRSWARETCDSYTKTDPLFASV